MKDNRVVSVYANTHETKSIENLLCSCKDLLSAAQDSHIKCFLCVYYIVSQKKIISGH